MTQKAFQDYYPDHFAHCYGCGRLNEHGLQIKSYWDGEESVCTFLPRPYHVAIPGYVYGGLIAFVTASLHVDYLRPTPLGVPLEVRGTVKEIKGRKIIIASTLSAGGEVCARGEVVAVQVPEDWVPK
jgi:hypothetical protein